MHSLQSRRAFNCSRFTVTGQMKVRDAPEPNSASQVLQATSMYDSSSHAIHTSFVASLPSSCRVAGKVMRAIPAQQCSSIPFSERPS